MQPRALPTQIHRYAVKRLPDGAILETFATKQEAKVYRNQARATGNIPCVVSRTAHHPNGESFPTQGIKHL